ncbi:MAG: acyl-CoA dehydrogenase family protein [Polyangiales bacterium]
MKRTVYGEEHRLFGKAFAQFVQEHLVPNQERYIEAGCVDRELWLKAGESGFLCPWLDEKYGGPGGDFLHSAIVMETLADVYESGWAVSLHSDIVVPYIYSFGSEEQKKHWLPKCASGEVVTAIAMTEPGTGSDLAAVAAKAVLDGDEYVINGAKTFISNGMSCDLCIVAARTDDVPGDPHRSMSLLLVEADRPGFIKSRRLKKMGMASQDTAELVFEDCRVPKSNLLGASGMGFFMLMQKLQQERLCVGIACQAGAEKVLKDTIEYCKDRKAFGKPISKFQNTQFKLVECATEVEIGRVFIDRLLEAHVAGQEVISESSMSKWWHSDMLGRVIDTCLQFFGGYGYMLEYPISRAYMDARVQRIFAGTNEIMKVIIAKRMGL